MKNQMSEMEDQIANDNTAQDMLERLQMTKLIMALLGYAVGTTLSKTSILFTGITKKTITIVFYYAQKNLMLKTYCSNLTHFIWL